MAARLSRDSRPARRTIARWLILWLFLSLALWLVLSGPAWSKDDPLERLQVTDPYLELRTGPGRGYPIFYVAERNEWIEITLRHTDWFKVRTAAGKEGWVDRRQLESTLTEAGRSKSFREVVLDDYLKRKLEFGAAYGRFKSEAVLKLWTSYNVTDVFAVELTGGQVQGVFSGTDFWHLNLLAQPWSDQRLAPYFGIGFGKFKNIPNASLVGAVNTDARPGRSTPLTLRTHGPTNIAPSRPASHFSSDRWQTTHAQSRTGIPFSDHCARRGPAWRARGR